MAPDLYAAANEEWAARPDPPAWETGCTRTGLTRTALLPGGPARPRTAVPAAEKATWQSSAAAVPLAASGRWAAAFASACQMRAAAWAELACRQSPEPDCRSAAP